MSKQSTARSRAEKTRTTANTALAPISNDIVPGKYNDYDWNLTLEREITEEYINILVEGILQKVEENIHKHYLKSRVIPFTVELAKNAMIKMIEWDFLRQDVGEECLFEAVWIEDDEPESCKIDSWAQGYFPKRQASFLYSHRGTALKECADDEFSKLEESEEEVEEYLNKSDVDAIESEFNSPDNKDKEESVECETRYEREHDVEDDIMTANESMTAATPKPTKTIFKPYRGKIKYNDLQMLTETLYETEMRFQLEKMRKDARLNRSSSSQSTTGRQMDAIDYEKKVMQKLFQTSVKDYKQLHTSDILSNANDQLVSLMKIPTEQLMAQRVRATHKMVDGILNKKNITIDKEGLGHLNSIERSVKPEEMKTPFIQGDKYPLPISMLDSIDPVPGVVVQEGDRIKKSANKKRDRKKQIEREFLKLRPIRTESIKASYLIRDIIDSNQIQIIKPIATSTPIPAITACFNRM